MKKRSDSNSRLVFTSESGAAPRPKTVHKQPTSDGTVRVRRETKGRGGKTVSVIMDLPLQGAELKALAKALKKKCGTGGTIVEGRIEIQGDHIDLLMSQLASKGFEVKKSGG